MRRRRWHEALTGTAALALGMLAGEALWAVLRPLPRLPHFDASVELGDPDAPPLRLTVLGDSTTTGTGLERADDLWARVLASRLARHRRVVLTCLGSGGATAARVRREQLPRALDTPGDVVFVSVGGNDALRWVPLRAFERDLEAVVSTLAPRTPLLVLSGVGDLGTIPRLLPPLDRIMRARGRRYDRVHRRLADRYGAVKADTWGWPAERFRTTPGIFSSDLLHPSALGHQVWAEAAWEAVSPHLGGSSGGSG